MALNASDAAAIAEVLRVQQYPRRPERPRRSTQFTYLSRWPNNLADHAAIVSRVPPGVATVYRRLPARRFFALNSEEPRSISLIICQIHRNRSERSHERISDYPEAVIIHLV